MQQLMMFRRAAPVPAIKLPDGWTIRSMLPGEEAVWPLVCGSEFGQAEGLSPLERWQRMMGSDPAVLPENVFFACDAAGQPMATATLRLLSASQLDRFPPARQGLCYLHYVAAQPSCRGIGIGSTVTARVLERGIELGLPECVLNTDDFRLAALKSYFRLGWMPVLGDPTMRARWQAVLAALGLDSAAAMDLDGNIMPL